MRSYNSLATMYVGTGVIPNGAEAVGSLNDAFREIYELRRSGVNQPITIKMTAGDYYFTKPLEIDEKLTAVTIEPYEGEVVFNGSKKITGFEKAVFNGVDCFGVFIPEVKNGEWKFTDLYVDGERANYTRYPAEGAFEILSAENNSSELFASSKWFMVKPDDIATVKSLNNAIVSFRHFWIDEHTPIEDYDCATGKLTLQKRSRFTVMNHKTDYYLENVAETFGKPNEWYLDIDNGMLYYMPRCECQTPENICVYAPVTGILLNITGKADAPVKNIRFRDIKFAYTRGDYDATLTTHGAVTNEFYASDSQGVANAPATINLEYAEYCIFDGCKITNYGLHGMNINKGCNNISVINSKFYDGGAGGIKINGASATGAERDITHSNTISNNVIHKCGRRHMAGIGVLMMHTHSNNIEHNDIHDLYYTGISGGWVWGYADTVSRNNIINKNHIYNLGQGLLSDMGGVYLLGAQPGTIVSNNLIHDVTSRDYGGWALYTDEGSGYMILENNVCYNTSNNSYHQHYGRINVVRNNIFAFSQREILCITRFEKHLSIIFENNILYTNGSEIYGISKRHFTNSTVGSGNNLVYAVDGNPIFNREFKTLEEVQKCGMDSGSLVADPCFVDAANYDFTLKAESPAFKLGFKAIDISDVGAKI